MISQQCGIFPYCFSPVDAYVAYPLTASSLWKRVSSKYEGPQPGSEVLRGEGQSLGGHCKVFRRVGRDK